MKSDLQAFLGLGLLCAVVNVSSLPAQADEVITQTTIAPNVILAPASSVTTTTRTIETSPTNSILVTPGAPYMVAPALADDTISRRTVIYGTRPASSSSSSESASVSTSADAKPKYGERLRLLRQQLDKGTSNGWIKPDQAAQLSSRLDALDSRESTVRSSGYLKVDCDSFEKDLTGFNIDLSHSMEGHS